MVVVNGQWRLGAHLRSRELGAAATFDRVVDWDDRIGLAPGLVDVLSAWTWQDGPDVCWWLGAVFRAPSAAVAAERATAAIADRTKGARPRAVSVSAVASVGELDEDLDAAAIPGSAEDHVVPVQIEACARAGGRLTIDWVSGSSPPARVWLTPTGSALVVGLLEDRPPHTGPSAAGETLVRRRRRVVVRLHDVPLEVPVADRYSGDYLPDSGQHGDEAPIDAFFGDAPGID